LADEVLFGKLKDGGAVRVIVSETEGKKALGFEYPEGKPIPKPEKEASAKPRKKRAAPRKSGKALVKAAVGGKSDDKKPGPRVRTVPKVPLTRE
jgi:ATP-dependent Clp protease ATP-binding subunit ClpA